MRTGSHEPQRAPRRAGSISRGAHPRLLCAPLALLALLAALQPLHSAAPRAHAAAGGAWPAARAQQPSDFTPDLATYTAWVREAAIAAARGDRIGLEDAAGRLVAVTAVRAPDGTPIPADNRWLAAELSAATPNMRRIATRLEALADALALPPGAAPADARERLKQILSRPPFEREVARPRWWDDFLDWLGRLLERLVRQLPAPSEQVSRPAAWVVGAVGALLLLGVIVYLLLGLRRSIVRDVVAPAGDPEEHLTARGALEQASELARGGDTRAAVRYLYLAALLQLDERGLLRYDRALTNREYLERVRDKPELLRRLEPVVATFDRVWYGHEPLSDEAYREFAAHVEGLRQG